MSVKLPKVMLIEKVKFNHLKHSLTSGSNIKFHDKLYKTMLNYHLLYV